VNVKSIIDILIARWGHLGCWLMLGCCCLASLCVVRLGLLLFRLMTSFHGVSSSLLSILPFVVVGLGFVLFCR
jgi:hypothetical protein